MMAEAATSRGRGRGRGAPRGGRGGYGQKRPAESFDYEDYGSGGGYTKKRKIMDDVYRFLVREDLVRAVIGKGGDHIRMIKEEAKAAGIETKVSIYAQGSNGAPLMEGAVDRVMSVQSTGDGLEMALTNLLPSVQIHHNHKSFRGGRGGGGAPGQKSQKLELRLLVPAHCCSGIIGKGGSVIKRIKEETNSYIQVYTLPMPGSEEHCVRIQNFEAPDLIATAVKVFESIADIKGKNPIIMYDPIYFEHGEYGDTGSYIDTEWYQEALRSGVAKPTPFKQIRGSSRAAHTAPAAPHAAYTGYEEEYEYGYEHEGYGYGYDEGYGYAEEEYGYEDYYAYAPPAPAPRARARGAPRARSRAAPPSRGYGAPSSAPRGYPPRGRGAPRGAAPRGAPRGYSRGAPRARGAPRGRGGPPPAASYAPEEAVE
ncbi:heterogeneous nuclear ribonucleoprotein K homolog [Bolinopsis microptera]|uniref:heterogeneous nuclear ribonucleoprotein K homolog n=1 Tax=Bolinopsis microptera TaxID=2820187 RepID=UPI003079CB02